MRLRQFHSIKPAMRATIAAAVRAPMVLRAGAAAAPLHPTVALAYASLGQVPASTTALQFLTVGRATGANEGEVPAIPGGYRRHGISRGSTDYFDPSLGALDLDAISTTWNIAQRAKGWAGQTEVQNDGSAFDQYESTPGGNLPGNAGGLYHGFYLTGRYLSVGGRDFANMQVEADGKYVKPFLGWPTNNVHNLIDFNTSAKRAIVLRGSPGFYTAGFSAEPNAVITPFDFMAGKTAWGFIGDGYLTAHALNLIGCYMPELLMRLCGGGAHATSTYYGTGFATAGGGVSMDDDQRINVVTSAPINVAVVMGGMEDAWPTVGGRSVNAAIQKVLRAIRSAKPNALLVVVSPWAPKQSVGAAAGGAPRAIRAAQLAELAATAGPWVHIDPLDGTWRTSNAKTRPVATGPWQTGDGWQGATTGTGNGDTWMQNDGRGLTETGVVGICNLFAEAFRGAVAALANKA